MDNNPLSVAAPARITDRVPQDLRRPTMRLSRPVLAMAAVVLICSAGFMASHIANSVPASRQPRSDGYPRGQALISAEDLQKVLAGARERVVVLAVVRPADFEVCRIPGSKHVWRPDYETRPGSSQYLGFEGMVAGPTQFEEMAATLGIDNNSTVVVYDDKYVQS